MSRTTRWIRLLAGLAAVLLVVTLGFVWMAARVPTWGATPAEVSQSLPGDELVTKPVITWDHVLTIQATPEEIYPWLIQIGDTRAAYYSYQYIENAFAGEKLYVNADRIHPEWQTPAIGQGMIMDFLTLAAYEPNQFVLAATTPKASESMNGFKWSWLWQLEPVNASQTRLHVRHRIFIPASMGDQAVGQVVTLTGYVMEKGMMDGIRVRAEGGQEPGYLEGLEIFLWLAVMAAGVMAAVQYLRQPDWRGPALLVLLVIVALFVLTYVQPVTWVRVGLALVLWGGGLWLVPGFRARLRWSSR